MVALRLVKIRWGRRWTLLFKGCGRRCSLLVVDVSRFREKKVRTAATTTNLKNCDRVLEGAMDILSVHVNSGSL